MVDPPPDIDVGWRWSESPWRVIARGCILDVDTDDCDIIGAFLSTKRDPFRLCFELTRSVGNEPRVISKLNTSAPPHHKDLGREFPSRRRIAYDCE